MKSLEDFLRSTFWIDRLSSGTLDPNGCELIQHTDVFIRFSKNHILQNLEEHYLNDAAGPKGDKKADLKQPSSYRHIIRKMLFIWSRLWDANPIARLNGRDRNIRSSHSAFKSTPSSIETPQTVTLRAAFHLFIGISISIVHLRSLNGQCDCSCSRSQTTRESHKFTWTCKYGSPHTLLISPTSSHVAK